MSSAYGSAAIPKPTPKAPLSSILPMQKSLRNGVHATLHRIEPDNEALIAFLFNLVNTEIEDGSTYPQENIFDMDGFLAYFLAYDAFVLVKGDTVPNKAEDMEENVLGTFYVKPNYPGRCSHICNAGFFTSRVHRGYGAGVAMGESFPLIGATLGYAASVFNLVFANNEASVKIWRKLGFTETGRIPKAGRLNNSPELVDAIIFYKDFSASS
ncbi:hypothetical protein BC940DRAFT_308406 [Gongronella butleri]|nr:hypothetical protein BC940DRAFT_308406 [Gongronella butleri]